MVEKKIQENPLPDDPPAEQGAPAMLDKADKPVVPPAPTPVAPRLSMPSLTKTPPNDLYRRLLPAVLFLLTFVTVMTMLLIYMDTVALGAQQFRLNMSRDYELARIGQESAPLVQYVRQLHLAPRAARPAPPPPPSARLPLLQRQLRNVTNGTFIEWMPRGPRDPTTLWLEANGLGGGGGGGEMEGEPWGGVVVRAAARDYLSLRGAARTLHACLSPTPHPREVTYHEAESAEAAFSSRVLCLPLLTVLLAADATRAEYALLAGDSVPAALRHLPFHRVQLQILDIRSTDEATRNKTTQFLQTKNYTVGATFDDGIMYFLNQS